MLDYLTYTSDELLYIALLMLHGANTISVLWNNILFII